MKQGIALFVQRLVLFGLEEMHRTDESMEGLSAKTMSFLKEGSYLRWYVPLRKLQSNMPQTIHRYNERISDDVDHFRNIDFTRRNFKTSGFLKN